MTDAAIEAPVATDERRAARSIMTVALVAMAAVVLVLAGFAWIDRKAALDHAAEHALATARAMAVDLGHHADTGELLLNEAELLLAATDWGRREAVEAARSRLLRLSRNLPYVTQVAITNAEGEVLVTTQQGLPAQRSGPEAPPGRDDGPAATAVSRGRGATRGLVFSRRVDAGDQARRGGVAVTVDADLLAAHFRAVTPYRDATMDVVRDDQVVLLREPPLPGNIQGIQRLEPELAALVGGAPSGVVRYAGATDGVEWILGYQRLPGRGLSVGVAVSRPAALATWWTRLGLGSALLGLVLVGLGTIAMLAGRRARGDARRHVELRLQKTSLEDVVRQRTDALERTVAELREVAEERQLLFSELNHRIRNNLQLIGSLFSLQASRIKDAQARAIFDEGIERVHSISLVHDLLYQSPHADTVDLGQLLRVLCDRLVTVFVPDGKVTCTVSAMSAAVSFDTAIRLGLIVNEIVSNLLKHAFPDDRRGHITVTFKEGEQLYRLTIVDDGIGPSMTTASGETRLGAQLVGLLGRNLDAVIHREQVPGGHRFELSLPR